MAGVIEEPHRLQAVTCAAPFTSSFCPLHCVCVCAFMLQAIYGWRGANPDNMEQQFEGDFQGCATVFLNRNYR